MQKKLLIFGIVGLCAIAVACGGDKKNPVSPTSSGDVGSNAGADGSTLKVNTPTPVSPINNAVTDSRTLRPVLVARHASGIFVPVTELTYRYEVVNGQGTLVSNVGQVPPGSADRSSFTMTTDLAYATDYRWRTRAEQGALVGPWSPYASFRTPDEPKPPTLVSPASGSMVESFEPSLVITNPALPLPGSGTTMIRFVVETSAGVGVVNSNIAAGSGLTSFPVPPDTLQATTSYRWRSRAELGSTLGLWSPYWTFTTYTPPPPTAPVVWPTTPGQLIGYVAGEYPSYLVATGSLHERERNMEFIRDRIIEAGICGGMDLAWNLKRGTGPKSTDALLHRDGRRDRVIDIAAGFDEYRVPMRLHWIEVEGPPGYSTYLPRPTCK